MSLIGPSEVGFLIFRSQEIDNVNTLVLICEGLEVANKGGEGRFDGSSYRDRESKRQTRFFPEDCRCQSSVKCFIK